MLFATRAYIKITSLCNKFAPKSKVNNKYTDWSIEKVKRPMKTVKHEDRSEISHAACREKQDNSGYTICTCTWPVGSRYSSLQTTWYFINHETISDTKKSTFTSKGQAKTSRRLLMCI